MKTVRIFISSPGDVQEEREKARLVVAQLQRRYAGRLNLVAVLWEDLPLQADTSFQHGIELVLSEELGIDIAVFILWSRLGSPLGGLLRKADGSVYRSGTEREFEVMLRARELSGGRKPAILAYLREDDAGFKEVLSKKEISELEALLQQHSLVQQFIREQFHDSQTGANTRAYHTFREPVSFATRLREHLRKQLDGWLPEETRPEARWTGPPFQGLELFQVEHADIFFGREQAVCDVQLALREQAARDCAFVLILGASGSGKSSLARAGVVASFIRDDLDLEVGTWRWGAMLPGASAEDLCLGLAQALAAALPELGEDQNSVAELGVALAQAPEVAFNLRVKQALKKAALAKAGRTKVLLVVDQLEELFTHSAVSAEAITVFLKALEALARGAAVWVVATMRSDFYARAQQFPELVRLKEGPGQYDLLPPGAAELHSIITEPVWLAGLRYERKEDTAESLDQRILNDAVKNPEALPLLEYLLRELYERRSAEGLLTFTEYERLGGVDGALGNRAEAVFQEMSIDVRAALPEVLNALSTVNEEEGHPVTRQRAGLSEIADTPEKKQLVERFLAERLFAADKGPDGVAVVQLAHEALLRGWERASRWARDNREFLRGRKRVFQAEARWKAEQESADFLLPAGKALAEAEALLTGHASWLNPELKRFIHISSTAVKTRERQRVKRLRAIAAGFAGLAILACAGGTVALIQKRNAERQAKIAQQTTKFITGMFESIDPTTAKLRDITVREVLDAAVPTIATNFPGEPDVELAMRSTILDIYSKLGMPDLALQQAELRVRLARAAYGEKDRRDVAGSLADLAYSLDALGRPAEAIADCRASLAMFQRLHEGDGADAVRCLDTLGMALGHLGQWTEALSTTQTALAICQRLYKGDNADLAVTLQNIAFYQRDLGRRTEALSNFEKALEMRQRLYKGDHPEVAQALNNLGGCLNDMARHAEALAKFEEALAMRRRIYKGDHPAVARSIDNVAACLNTLGRSDEALTNLIAGLEMWRRIYKGGDHPDVAVNLRLEATCLNSIGRREEALTNFEAAVAMRERLSGDDNPELARSLQELGSCLSNLRRYREALAKHKAALEMYQRLFKGKDNNWVALSLNNVAVAFDYLEQVTNALPFYEAALAMRQRMERDSASGSVEDLQKVSDVAESLYNLAGCLEELGRSSDAIRDYQEAALRRQHLAAAQPSEISSKILLARTQQKLGDLVAKTGDTNQAKAHYLASLQTAQSVLSMNAANPTGKKLREYLRLRLRMDKADVVVSIVAPGKQGERIGLRQGDVLVRYAGQQVTYLNQLGALIAATKGADVGLEVRRGDRALTFMVKPGPLGVLLEERAAQNK